MHNINKHIISKYISIKVINKYVLANFKALINEYCIHVLQKQLELRFIKNHIMKNFYGIGIINNMKKYFPNIFKSIPYKLENQINYFYCKTDTTYYNSILKNYKICENITKIINKFKEYLSKFDVILILMQFSTLKIDFETYSYLDKKYNIFLNSITPPGYVNWKYIYSDSYHRTININKNSILFIIGEKKDMILNYNLIKKLILNKNLHTDRSVYYNFLQICKIKDFKNIIQRIFVDGDFSKGYSYITITKHRRQKLKILIEHIESFNKIKVSDKIYEIPNGKCKDLLLYSVSYNDKRIINKKDMFKCITKVLPYWIHLWLFNEEFRKKIKKILYK
jgi:hypothetical protein